MRVLAKSDCNLSCSGANLVQVNFTTLYQSTWKSANVGSPDQQAIVRFLFLRSRNLCWWGGWQTQEQLRNPSGRSCDWGTQGELSWSRASCGRWVWSPSFTHRNKFCVQQWPKDPYDEICQQYVHSLLWKEAKERGQHFWGHQLSLNLFHLCRQYFTGNNGVS